MDGTRIAEATALKGVGLGVYTPAEAARLIDVPSSTLRGWMTDRRGREPLWRSEHADWDGALLLSFRDLVEARVLDALRKQGFSTQQLRGTMAYAREQIGDERPFSTKVFKTDGADIMLDLPDGLLVVSRRNRGQNVFREAIAPVLRPIEYGDTVARILWMQPKKRTIVLDPERAFGAPILHDCSIPTAVLASSVAAEGSPAITARYFDVPVSLVRDAVKFEERLAA